jgi:anthranilate synthase component 1
VEIENHCDLLELHRTHPARYPYLLESVARNASSGRYDILFAFPGDTLVLGSLENLTADALNVQGTDFLANFDAWWAAERTPFTASGDLPFNGGWFVYLGYELSQQIESRLIPTPTAQAVRDEITDTLPIAYATRVPAALIRDNAGARLFAVAEAGQEYHLQQMVSDAQGISAITTSLPGSLADNIEEESAIQFLERIARIQHYIKNGDVFQVNLSRLWQGDLKPHSNAVDIYRRLREHNPAPFAGLARYQDTTIISSSPERLVKVQRDTVETRPIAGTRPRGQSGVAETQALLAHPKERAEHIMLIDLERNDLGRVCIAGSVQVDELMSIESYAHVHHIVSNISGQLRSDVTPGEILRAVFPGGTITGCPKVRCMEIIAELEQAPRNAYTGSMGYINRDGSMDFNILIRTLVTQKQHITLRAGAGIVADSIPQRELEETRAKARGMLLALC